MKWVWRALQETATGGVMRQSAVNLAGIAGAGLFGYLFQLVASRRLPVGEFGELQSLAGLLGILTVFPHALQFVGVKFIAAFGAARDGAGTRSFLRWWNRRTMLFAVIGFAAFALFAPVVARALHLSDLRGLLALALAVSFSVAGIGWQSTLVGWQRFRWVGIANAGGAFVKLAACVAIVWAFPTASSVAWSIPVAALAGWSLTALFAKRTVLPSPGAPSAAFHPSFSARNALLVSVFLLSVGVFKNLDMLFVRNLLSDETSGLYAAARVLGSAVLLVNAAIVAVCLPALCAAGGDRAKVRITLRDASSLITLITAGATIAFAVAPSAIIAALFGAKYVAIAPHAWLFAIAAGLISLFTLEANLAYARNDFGISWIILGGALLLSLLMYLFHASVETVIVAVTASNALAYLGALVWNRARDGRVCAPPGIVEVGTHQSHL